MEDWLKARLKLSTWSTRALAQLAVMAIKKEWITRGEATRLKQIRNARLRLHEQADNISIPNVEAALEFCIRLVEKHW